MSLLLLRHNVEWGAVDNEGRSSLQRVAIGLSIEGPSLILESLYVSPRAGDPVFDRALAVLDKYKVMQSSIYDEDCVRVLT